MTHVGLQQTGHTEDDILAQNSAEAHNPLFRDSRAAATGSSRNATDDVSVGPPLDTGAESTVLSVDELFNVVDTDGRCSSKSHKSRLNVAGHRSCEVTCMHCPPAIAGLVS